MSSTWDPRQYMRYASERERPFWELIAQVPIESPRQVVDLGCGPGTTTSELLHRWPQASVLGIDSSPSMIEQATRHAQPPRLGFQLLDIRDFQPQPRSLDVILSNAALHWVEGHLGLLPGWLHGLTPQGALAFQVPRNFDAPSHTALAELVRSPRWRKKLSGVALSEQPTPSDYYTHLRALGATVEMWETIYHHSLTGPDPVLEWVAGTALRPYLALLDDDESDAFTASYAAALREAYPPQPSGETLFPFRRLFVVATL